MRSIMTTTTRQGHGQAEAEPHYVVCESAEGWSLHAPGSTDAEIASGDAPALVSGAWEGEDHEIPEWAHEALEGLDDDAEPRLEPGDILTGGRGRGPRHRHRARRD